MNKCDQVVIITNRETYRDHNGKHVAKRRVTYWNIIESGKKNSEPILKKKN